MEGKRNDEAAYEHVWQGGFHRIRVWSGTIAWTAGLLRVFSFTGEERYDVHAVIAALRDHIWLEATGHKAFTIISTGDSSPIETDIRAMIFSMRRAAAPRRRPSRLMKNCDGGLWIAFVVEERF